MLCFDFCNYFLPSDFSFCDYLHCLAIPTLYLFASPVILLAVYLLFPACVDIDSNVHVEAKLVSPPPSLTDLTLVEGVSGGFDGDEAEFNAAVSGIRPFRANGQFGWTADPILLELAPLIVFRLCWKSVACVVSAKRAAFYTVQPLSFPFSLTGKASISLYDISMVVT